MQAIFVGAKAGDPLVGPVFLAANDVTVDVTTSLFQADINFGNEDGANRLLVILYLSEDVDAVVHSGPKYNGVSGVFISEAFLDGGQAVSLSATYWLEANLPSSSGLKEFEMTLAANQRGHMARAFLFKNVDQTTPIGTAQKTTKQFGVPTFQISLTATSLQTKAVILGAGMGVNGPTYVTGDLKDNGSNMNDIVEQQARPNTNLFGGGALATAHDVVPDASEVYAWDCKFGSATTVDATVALLIPINVAP